MLGHTIHPLVEGWVGLRGDLAIEVPVLVDHVHLLGFVVHILYTNGTLVVESART